MSQVPPDPELNEIESALGQLTPARSRVDRDRIMFQAGVLHAKAESRRRWVWPSIAATLAVVALSESVALAVRPGPRVVVVQQPAPAPESRPAEPEPVQILSQAPPSRAEGDDPWSAGGGEALALRRQVLRFGVDGLPDPPSLLSQSDGSAAESSTPVASLRIRQGDQAWRTLVMRASVWSLAFAASLLPWAARGQDETESPPPTVITIRPAASPVPALKYSLLPKPEEQIPGNAAIFYHRAIERHDRDPASPDHPDPAQDSRRHRRGCRGRGGASAAWLTQPLATLPREAVRKVPGTATQFSLHEIELGARREFCDWEFQRRDEGFNLILEDMQEMRSLGRLLVLKTRLEIAEGRIDSGDPLAPDRTGRGATCRQPVEHPDSDAHLRRDDQPDGRPARGADPGPRCTEPLLGAGQSAQTVPRPHGRDGRGETHAREGVSPAQDHGPGALEHRAGPGVLGRFPEEDGDDDRRLGQSVELVVPARHEGPRIPSPVHGAGRPGLSRGQASPDRPGTIGRRGRGHADGSGGGPPFLQALRGGSR